MGICGVFLSCVGRESSEAFSGAPAENCCEHLQLTSHTAAETAYCYADQNLFDPWSGDDTSGDWGAEPPYLRLRRNPAAVHGIKVIDMIITTIGLAQ